MNLHALSLYVSRISFVLSDMITNIYTAFYGLTQPLLVRYMF